MFQHLSSLVPLFFGLNHSFHAFSGLCMKGMLLKSMLDYLERSPTSETSLRNFLVVPRQRAAADSDDDETKRRGNVTGNAELMLEDFLI